MIRLFPVLLAAALFIPAAASATTNTPVRVLMHWVPQAQFAGYYVAAADGLYRAAGLDVEISHVSSSQDSFKLLTAGRCDYASGWLSAALISATSGIDIVNVAQFHQGTSLAIIARRDSGVNRLEDLAGRPVAFWTIPAFRLPLNQFLAVRHVVPSVIHPMLDQPDLFLRGGADAMSGMTFNEYNALLMAGFETNELAVFRVEDTIPDLVDDGLYTLRSVYDRDPSVASRLRVATIEGWRRAFANPAHALALVKRQCFAAGRPFAAARQRAMLAELRKVINRPGNDGRLRHRSFNVHAALLGLPSDAVSFERFAPGAGGEEEEARP